MTYYMGIPLDYAENISKTTSMLAFEAYETREVRLYLPLIFISHCYHMSLGPG